MAWTRHVGDKASAGPQARGEAHPIPDGPAEQLLLLLGGNDPEQDARRARRTTR